MTDIMSTIYGRLRHLSSAVYPRTQHFLVQEKLLDKKDLIDEILFRINKIEKFYESDCSLYLSDSQYDTLWKWIEKTVAHNKAALYYKVGIHAEDQRTDYVDYVQLKALHSTEAAIDSTTAHGMQAATRALQLTFDSELIKAETKLNSIANKSKHRELERILKVTRE
jgi:hypothetical protein